ncbi:hypothetical protein [Microbacterium sp. GXF7504]
MIEDFLRPPRTVGEALADLVRILGVVSVGAAAIWGSPTDAGILAFALPALLVPRFLGLRAGFDLAYGVAVLGAAWSNVLDLYRTIPWWDVPAHLVCTGMLSLVLFLALERWGVIDVEPLRARRRLVLLPALGLAVSALWEMVEWFGKTFLSDAIFVTYDDTIGDMAVGGVGAFLAALVLGRLPLARPRPSRDGCGDDGVMKAPTPHGVWWN